MVDVDAKLGQNVASSLGLLCRLRDDMVRLVGGQFRQRFLQNKRFRKHGRLQHPRVVLRDRLDRLPRLDIRTHAVYGAGNENRKVLQSLHRRRKGLTPFRGCVCEQLRTFARNRRDNLCAFADNRNDSFGAAQSTIVH